MNMGYIIMSYIATDDNIVLVSESLILDRPDTSVSIPIVYQGEDKGVIILRFTEKEDVNTGGIKHSIENGALVLECFNFTESFGRFTSEPLDIGDLDGKKLSLQIWSALNGNETKIRRLQFTLFMEK